MRKCGLLMCKFWQKTRSVEKHDELPCHKIREMAACQRIARKENLHKHTWKRHTQNKQQQIQKTCAHTHKHKKITRETHGQKQGVRFRLTFAGGEIKPQQILMSQSILCWAKQAHRVNRLTAQIVNNRTVEKVKHGDSGNGRKRHKCNHHMWIKTLNTTLVRIHSMRRHMFLVVTAYTHRPIHTYVHVCMHT